MIDDYTPAHLEKITPWSAEAWHEAYNMLGYRDDWPKLVAVSIRNGWHPLFLVSISGAFEWFVGRLEHFGVLRRQIPDRFLFPRRSAMHRAYRQRQLARRRRQ